MKHDLQKKSQKNWDYLVSENKNMGEGEIFDNSFLVHDGWLYKEATKQIVLCVHIEQNKE